MYKRQLDSSVRRWNGRALGMYCLPGCVLPWEEYGYKHNFSERTNRGVSADWCAKRTIGCEAKIILGEKCAAEVTGPALCRQLRFSDVNYGESDVE